MIDVYIQIKFVNVLFNLKIYREYFLFFSKVIRKIQNQNWS